MRAPAASTTPLGPQMLVAVDRAADLLCARIADGTYRPSTSTPALVQLAAQFGVTTGIMHQAVRRLKRTGIIATCRQGRAVIADAACEELERRALASCPAPQPGPEPESESAVNRQITQLAARIRGDIASGAWLPGQPRTRRELREGYQVPGRVVAGAVRRLRIEQVVKVRRRVGVRPLPGPPSMAGPHQAAAESDTSPAGSVEASARLPRRGTPC
ncbi:GntR family transcriptional regulator [Streptomyces sp. cg36]|uniref:GntR family transcriptional regulator n=1 Tax=Streptomyces sp. cg36 TaxID=3238798 RepID=UPI0034E1F342